MQIDSNQYLDECNSFLYNRQFSKAEKSLGKSFKIDCSYFNINIDDLILKTSFNLTQYGMDLDESIDKFIIKVVTIIEVYVENVSSIDSIMWDKFNKFITTLNLLLSLGRNTKQWSLIYKTRSMVYLILNDKLNAFKSVRIALYFEKSKTIKSLFLKFTNEYGKNYRIDNSDFNFILLNNIFFKSVQNEIDDNASPNKKYLIDGKHVYVEDIAIDYYTKKGFSAFHSENYFWSFNSDVFFRDITQNYYMEHKDVEIFKKELFDRVHECEKIPFKQYLKKYYYSNKYLEYHNGAFSSKEEGYYTDYVEFDGYDTWVERLDAIGIKKCLKLLLERKLHGFDQRLPLSGLPDLFVYKDKQCFFVEVKSTNDRLSFKQKWWHMFISEELNIPIVIFMVNKSEKQIKSIKRHYLI